MYGDTLAKCLTSTSLFPFHHRSFEAARILWTLSSDCLCLVCVYRALPSRKNKLTDAMFHGEFPDLLDFCYNLSGNCIILGDMNVYFDSPNNLCTAKLLNSFDVFNFSQAVNEPTHERGHTLDWIMVRPEDNVLCSTSVTESIASEHFFVVCELCVAVPPDPAVYRESRNIRAIDRAAFRGDLCMLVSPELCPSIDDFNNRLQSLLEQHAPFRRRRVRADRLEPRYRDIKDELEAAKKHKR